MEALLGCLYVLVPLLIALLWVGDRKYRIGVIWRGIPMKIRRWREGPFPCEELAKDHSDTAVCVDLGAFRWPLQILPPWIKTVVLMGDRQWGPEFFLGQDHSRSIFGDYGDEKISLNRHGPHNCYKNRKDLAELVEELHKQGKKVTFGFGAFYSDPIRRAKSNSWLGKHRELRPRKRDESDFGNLFVRLEKEVTTLAEYIAKQYRETQKTYGFDGLFLGNGFCGYKCFFYPERYRDLCRTACPSSFANFYRTIANSVHQTGGQLWAYDCQGFSEQEALFHGVDYLLLSEAGLDVLVFQTYPTAWGPDYFRVPGKTGVGRDAVNFVSVQKTLQETGTKLYYTLEMGDSVEGWRPSHESTRQQMEAFGGKSCPKPADGKLVVWSNDFISQL